MNKISAKRIHWIDVVKGILMFMVVWSHCDNQATSAGIDDKTIQNLSWLEHTWVPYIMPAFYILSGYCSNFNKSFNQFIISKLKSLIIPAISIGILTKLVQGSGAGVITVIQRIFLFGPSWFLAALFLSCIIYYFINKCLPNYKQKYLSLFLSIIIGLSLNLYLPGCTKIWHLPHALMLLPFLEVGAYYKNHKELIFSRKAALISILLYITTLLTIFLITDYGKIGIYRQITITWVTLLPCYVCSVAGSVLVFNIGRTIRKVKILEYVGRNSILFYLLNYPLLKLYFGVYHAMFGSNTISSIAGFIAVFLVTNITIAIVSEIMNTKHISYLLGKF